MNEQTRWHDWEIREKLGSGSYGQVYRIERTSFGFTEQSALKVMRIPQSREDYESVLSESASGEDTACYFKGMVHEIVKEIEIMSQFKGHSNIVSYEDFEVRELEGGCSWEIFIRMELLTPLATWLKTHPILVADVVRIGTDICSALEMCSRKQVIHRDVKPANIFYSAQDTFKIGDFGIARSMESTSTATAKRGTPAYMAPEVYKGERYDATVDLYSLGIVLYQLLNNNRAPFLPPYPDPIRHTDRETSTRKRMSGDPMPLPCNAQNALGEVVLKACAYRPEDRYQSAEELREALQEAVESLGSAAAALCITPAVGMPGSTISSTMSLEESVSQKPEPAEEVPAQPEVPETPEVPDEEDYSSHTLLLDEDDLEDPSNRTLILEEDPEDDDNRTLPPEAFETDPEDDDQLTNDPYERTEENTADPAETAEEGSREGNTGGGSGDGSSQSFFSRYKIPIIIVAVIAAAALFVWFFVHIYTEPTCTEPAVCKICGKVGEPAKGHTWMSATCTTPKTCSTCWETEGQPLGHDYAKATCTEPKTCKRCGATDGEPLGHDWAEATYDKPKTCRRCGKTEGTVKGLVSSVSLTFVDESVDPVGTYYKIDTELKNCRRITVSYHLSEVKKGNVFGTCAFYVRSNGKWYRIGSIEVTELNKEYEKTFTISPSRTIDAIGETFEDATGAYSTMRKIKVLEAQVD